MLKKIVRRFAVCACALIAAACAHESTQPTLPVRPELVITSPSDTVASDTVDIRGEVRAGSCVTGVIAFIGNTYQWADVVPTCDTAVPFRMSVTLGPGSHTLKFVAYLAPRLPFSGSATDSVTANVSFVVYRRGSLAIASPFPDTVYQRSFSFRIATAGISNVMQPSVVFDPGTASEHSVTWTYPIEDLGLRLDPSYQTGPTMTFSVSSVLPLANGTHQVIIRLRDDSGIVDSVKKEFVVNVADAPYRVDALTDLGAGGALGQAINVRGDIAGVARDSAGALQAIVWHGTTPTILSGMNAWGDVVVNALNSADDVVGAASTSTCTRPVAWIGGRPFAYDSTLVAKCASVARDINDRGDVLLSPVGLAPGDFWNPSGPNTNSIIVHRDGSTTQLDFGGHAENSNGGVVGDALTVGEEAGAAWTGITGLTLPLFPWNGADWSEGLIDVNDQNQVIGTQTYDGRFEYLAQPGHDPVDLTLAFGSYTHAATLIALNNAGAVLAWDGANAYLWSAGRTRRVAIDPAYTLTSVTAMNDAGQIVGSASVAATGKQVAVRLTPR